MHTSDVGPLKGGGVYGLPPPPPLFRTELCGKNELSDKIAKFLKHLPEKKSKVLEVQYFDPDYHAVLSYSIIIRVLERLFVCLSVCYATH